VKLGDRDWWFSGVVVGKLSGLGDAFQSKMMFYKQLKGTKGAIV
jgi:hypothetical protein